MADTAEQDTIQDTEDRVAPEVGRLNADERIEVRERPRSLADEFRAAGWPGQTATIDFSAFESRAVTGVPGHHQPDPGAGRRDAV
jgi:hypothetical protein